MHCLMEKSVNISSHYKKHIFYSDNNRSLDTTGHGAKWSTKRLDQMIFWGNSEMSM